MKNVRDWSVKSIGLLVVAFVILGYVFLFLCAGCSATSSYSGRATAPFLSERSIAFERQDRIITVASGAGVISAPWSTSVDKVLSVHNPLTQSVAALVRCEHDGNLDDLLALGVPAKSTVSVLVNVTGKFASSPACVLVQWGPAK